MAGSKTLRQQIQVLRALEAGPATKADIKRALGLDSVAPAPQLDHLLQTMRIAGLVETVGRGTWKIVEGLEVCPHCHGRGVRDAG